MEDQSTRTPEELGTPTEPQGQTTQEPAQDPAGEQPVGDPQPSGEEALTGGEQSPSDPTLSDSAATPSAEMAQEMGQQPAQAAAAPQSSEPARPGAPARPTADITDDMSMEEAMNMADALAQSGPEMRPVNRGEVVTGTVVFISTEGLMVDIGAKIEGLIPFSQIDEEPITPEEAQQRFKPGDEVEAFVVRSDITNGVIVLSIKRAEQDKGWRVLRDLHEKGETFTVQVEEKVRGGLVAQIEGVRAFLPASLVDLRRVNDLDSYVGNPLEVKLIELERRRNRVIISHRAILEGQKAEAREETMKRLEPGAVFEGEVVEITDFGVFVNLGGIDGLVHRSELTFGRFNHPREVVQRGDKVQVQVVDLDEGRDRINLSMKALTNDPWEEATDKYMVGQRIRGKVTNLTAFGAFIEIEPGLEGLVHVSEMSWTKRVRHPNEVLTEGEEVEAMILRIDADERRISLGIRQTTEDPWSQLPDRYPPGTLVKGKVTGLTDFGVFMEIEEGIEGLIHISELDLQRVDNPADLFKKGDDIEASILNIDPVEQRASLSRRRALGGAPARGGDYVSQGGGSRNERYGAGGGGAGAGGGRRGGGRRGGGSDYAYAAKDASSGKISTKLGDVYADLFAQFGLGDKPEAKSDEQSGSDTETKA